MLDPFINEGIECQNCYGDENSYCVFDSIFSKAGYWIDNESEYSI